MAGVATPEASTEAQPDPEERHRLTVLQGLSALSLDALSSVAYGPEAIVLVLAAAGSGALEKALPVTIVIAALLAVLVFAYRQVIAAHPEGGGAYAVSAQQLGQRWSWLAAASLIVDYILNVGVSIAAGIAALTSTFPSLHSKTLLLCLIVVAGLTAVNLRGVVESARLLIGPTLVFIAGVVGMIVFDMVRSHPETSTGGAPLVKLTDTVGIWLLLRAFSAGCSALTGVEAIANAVPQFRKPRVRRAQHTEVLLGLLLGLMLLGIAHVIGRFHLEPRHGVTVLDQLSAAAYGRGVVYYVFGIVTTIVLTLAANTSFGGLPVLLSLLARDNLLPHAFGLRGERPVFRYGVALLGLAGAALLTAVNGDTQRLVPLFAIGVFIGFTLSQVGLAPPGLPVTHSALAAHRRRRHRRRVPDCGCRRGLSGDQVPVRGLGRRADGAVVDDAVRLGAPVLRARRDCPGARRRSRPGRSRTRDWSSSPSAG